MTEIVEGMRVKTTRPLDVWICHLRHIESQREQIPSAPDGTISLEFRWETERETSLRLGYGYDQSFPQVPAGTKGVVRRIDTFVIAKQRPLPHYITKHSDKPQYDRIVASFSAQNGEEYYERISLPHEESPVDETARFDFWMWSVEFDGFATDRIDSFAGLKDKDSLPDYLEPVTEVTRAL